MKKILKDNKGFTLTEVMIGIMILTVAIVSASNMLVTLLRANQINLTSMQAHYFAVEGLEAVRNIRDTNWLHNKDWLGEGMEDVWGGEFEVGDSDFGSGFGVVYSDAFEGANSPEDHNFTLSGISIYSPWSIVETSSEIIECENENYFTNCGGGEGFTRTIRMKKYDGCGDINLGCADENTILVESKVEWSIGADDRELVLYTLFTDWKGGVF